MVEHILTAVMIGGMISPLDAIRRRRHLQMEQRDLESEEDTAPSASSSQAASLEDGQVLLEPSKPNGATVDLPHLLFRHKNQDNGVVSAVVLSSDGTLLAAAWDDIVVTIWRLSDGKLVQQLEDSGHSDSVWTIAFSPDNQQLLSFLRMDKTSPAHRMTVGLLRAIPSPENHTVNSAILKPPLLRWSHSLHLTLRTGMSGSGIRSRESSLLSIVGTRRR